MSRIKLGNFAVSSLLFILLIVPALVIAQSTSPAQPASAAAPSDSAKSPTARPTAADIAAAKASGKVWVNLGTGVYHKAGRWYGKTKDGKFMTEDEARKAGYKAAKRD
jgi:hypothetical protein